ncbi:putative porin [Sphingomonas sp.]|uniref:putative porin n=1 Tax=Sphingomonas sp. TaxID=28214 RepID=UPI003D6D0A47
MPVTAIFSHGRRAAVSTPKGTMMTCPKILRRFRSMLLAGTVALTLASPAFAQNAQVDPNKLLEIMVTKGLVTRAEADAMIAEARVAPTPQVQAAIPPGGVVGDTQTIPYIPTTVRNQIKAELRAELASQASTEGWAKPGEVAEWTKRLTLFGDIRVRGEGDLMGKGNFNQSFVNFQAINAGAGYNINDLSSQVSAPYLNTTKNRTRANIRARLGLRARIDSWITGEIRVATGGDNSPISTNQTLGGNGQFGKYAIWLDRANIRLQPVKGATLDLGRFANPFWTSELLFDEDLNFDGVALSGRAALNGQLTVFGTLGAFPIFNTDFNFGSNDVGAFSSKDKYLAAAQAGVEFAASDHVKLAVAASYYEFKNVQGEVSSPCPFDQDACDTDASRPQFVRTGNSLFPIRNIDFAGAPNPATAPEVQYFGLASKYRILNAHAALDLGFFAPVGIRLEADFVKNLGFDRKLVAARAVNNLGPGNPGVWAGGDTGWFGNLIIGKSQLTESGDWHASIGYRRIESDAVLDAFTDSDFHLGGTNAKGFILGGSYAIAKDTALSARWLSSDAITGIPYSNDVIQLDLTTRF